MRLRFLVVQVELKPTDPTKRVQRVHINNCLLPGGCRSVQLYAPYWLINNTGLPLMFREVRLGINTSVGSVAHTMNDLAQSSLSTLKPDTPVQVWWALGGAVGRASDACRLLSWGKHWTFNF